MQKYFLILNAVILSYCSLLDAAPGTKGAQFLAIGPGAKAAAMGEAYSSACDDASAIFWNPAGLPEVKDRELMFQYGAWLVDTGFHAFGAVIPEKAGNIGIGVTYFDAGKILSTDSSGIETGYFGANSCCISLGIGRKISESINAGITAKTVREMLDTEVAGSFALDAGIICVQDKFKFGFTVQNIGYNERFVEKFYPLPVTVKLGASCVNSGFLFALDLNQPAGNNMSLNAGIDYSLHVNENLAVSPRLGYNSQSALSAGIGLGCGNYSIDYAFVPYGDIGPAHRVSMSIRFGEEK